MALTISLIAIIVAIVIGWKFKCNTGIIAMALAFIIGPTIMGLRVSQIISFFPTTVVFYLISIGLFFTYATENGTMDLLGRKMLYATNGNAKMIPFVVALVTFMVSLLGAGPSTAIIVGPLSFKMAAAAGVHPIIICIILVVAMYFGADNPFNGYGGVISLSLMQAQGYENALSMQMHIWLSSTIKGVLTILLAYFLFKGYKAKRIELEKPDNFSPVQKKTLVLIIIVFIVMIVPTALATYVGGAFFASLSRMCQPQAIMIIAAVVAVFMNLGDEKVILRKQNFSMIITIVGINILMSVATAAGLIDTMAGVLGGSFPTLLIGPLFCLFGAFLSFFSSGMSVVCPLLYPLVTPLAAALGLNPTMLFASIYIGTMSTAISPFSSGGAILISVCDNAETQDSLTRWLIPTAIVITLLSTLLSLLGVFNL